MELVLVRHALPVRRELSEAIADPELAPDGHVQAARMAAYLATEDIAAVYVSPLRRAQETAAPLVEMLGISPTVDDAKTRSQYFEKRNSGANPVWLY